MKTGICKRFIGGNMYVKREDGSYWLGVYLTKDSIRRIRISKETYDQILRDKTIFWRKAAQ